MRRVTTIHDFRWDVPSIMGRYEGSFWTSYEEDNEVEARDFMSAMAMYCMHMYFDEKVPIPMDNDHTIYTIDDKVVSSRVWHSAIFLREYAEE